MAEELRRRERAGKGSTNDVRLSGKISRPPRLAGQSEEPNHLVFHLETWHESGRGLKREEYTVHAWNGVAARGIELLRQGQEVVLEGYLTQRERMIKGSDIRYRVVDVTARRFFVIGSAHLAVGEGME